jgi:hypothetical protein
VPVFENWAVEEHVDWYVPSIVAPKSIVNEAALVTTAPGAIDRTPEGSIVAVPWFTSLPPLTVTPPLFGMSHVAPLATVTVPGPVMFPPDVVSAPVTLSVPATPNVPFMVRLPVDVELVPLMVRLAPIWSPPSFLSEAIVADDPNWTGRF